MNNDLILLAKKIIQDIKYITIATVTPDGKPWNSPVFSAFDEQYIFYWNSWTENQHSKNIAHNPNVFLVIYDSTVSEGTGQGVYIQATVKVIEDIEQIERTRKLMQDRKDKPSSKLRSPHEFLGKYPRRVYMATPEKIWMNGSGEVNGNFVDIRTEIDLKDFIKSV